MKKETKELLEKCVVFVRRNGLTSIKDLASAVGHPNPRSLSLVLQHSHGMLLYSPPMRKWRVNPDQRISNPKAFEKKMRKLRREYLAPLVEMSFPNAYCRIVEADKKWLDKLRTAMKSTTQTNCWWSHYQFSQIMLPLVDKMVLQKT